MDVTSLCYQKETATVTVDGAERQTGSQQKKERETDREQKKQAERERQIDRQKDSKVLC